ncbi:conserved hypothetical protein [Cupriavidus taiwanensis]|nr:conserved hypothetical protein [Cupriavidus taiwanensis]
MQVGSFSMRGSSGEGRLGLRQERRRGFLDAVEGDQLVGFLVGEQRAQQLVVQAMAGFVRHIGADQRMAHHVQVADRIQDLVAHELVAVAQFLVVEHAVLVQHDRVVQAAAARQAHFAQGLDLVRKAEGAGAGNLAHVAGVGEIDREGLAGLVDRRVAEVDGERQLEAEERLQPRQLVAFAHFHRLLHADEGLGRILLLDASRLQQEHERRRAAVHDRDFLGVDVDIEIVDAQAGAGGHQVLDGGNARASLLQHRRQARVADGRSGHGNLDGLGQVDASEDDAGTRRRRTQRQRDLAAGVQADANGLHKGFDRALFEHDSLNNY